MTHEAQIITSTSGNWCELATSVITSTVKTHITAKGICTLMLTGGNTAKQLYKHWTEAKPWNHREVGNFFGDESCVTPDHQDSNYCMMKNALFLKSIPQGLYDYENGRRAIR